MPTCTSRFAGVHGVISSFYTCCVEFYCFEKGIRGLLLGGNSSLSDTSRFYLISLHCAEFNGWHAQIPFMTYFTVDSSCLEVIAAVSFRWDVFPT